MSLATGLYFLAMRLFTRAHSYKHPAQTKLWPLFWISKVVAYESFDFIISSHFHCES